MRFFRFSFFVAVVICVYLFIAAGHRLIAQRLVVDPGIQPPMRTILVCSIAVAGYLAIAPYFLPFMGWLQTPFIAGMYRRNNSRLYVSRGTGFWGPPMRVFAPAEITEIVIRQG
jgi:hypothetical protein